MGDILGAKGIPHEVNLWGYDVSHDWHWWHRQIAEYLPRFC
jgi:esterase/lipase superfamily enzyme